MRPNHEDEKIELNLDNPIFVCYIDNQGMSRQRTEEYVEQVQKCFRMYSNITVWIFPTNKTEIQCIWYGNYTDGSIDKIVNNLNRFKEIVRLKPAEFQQQIRDILIQNLTDEKNI